jgi:hypothetical protein
VVLIIGDVFDGRLQIQAYYGATELLAAKPFVARTSDRPMYIPVYLLQALLPLRALRFRAGN